MIDDYGNRHIDVLRDWEYIPGHRRFSFDIQTASGKQIHVDLTKEASLIMASEILRMHDTAWMDGRPHDASDNEEAPDWIMPVNKRRYLCSRHR